MVTQPNTDRPPRILRMREVEGLTGLKRTAIESGVAKGTFPQPVKLTTTAIGWHEDEIHEWIRSRPVSEGPRQLELDLTP